jgi:hypothetical protein
MYKLSTRERKYKFEDPSTICSKVKSSQEPLLTAVLHITTMLSWLSQALTGGRAPQRIITEFKGLGETPENPHTNIDLDPSVEHEPNSSDPVSPGRFIQSSACDKLHYLTSNEPIVVAKRRFTFDDVNTRRRTDSVMASPVSENRADGAGDGYQVVEHGMMVGSPTT